MKVEVLQWQDGSDGNKVTMTIHNSQDICYDNCTVLCEMVVEVNLVFILAEW